MHTTIAASSARQDVFSEPFPSTNPKGFGLASAELGNPPPSASSMGTAGLVNLEWIAENWMSDDRLCIPSTMEERRALSHAIQITRNHILEICGFYPKIDSYSHCCYWTQWAELRRQLNEFWANNGFLSDPPLLAGRGQWTGGILNWFTAPVASSWFCEVLQGLLRLGQPPEFSNSEEGYLSAAKSLLLRLLDRTGFIFERYSWKTWRSSWWTDLHLQLCIVVLIKLTTGFRKQH